MQIHANLQGPQKSHELGNVMQCAANTIYASIAPSTQVEKFQRVENSHDALSRKPISKELIDTSGRIIKWRRALHYVFIRTSDVKHILRVI